MHKQAVVRACIRVFFHVQHHWRYRRPCALCSSLPQLKRRGKRDCAFVRIRVRSLSLSVFCFKLARSARVPARVYTCIRSCFDFSPIFRFLFLDILYAAVIYHRLARGSLSLSPCTACTYTHVADTLFPFFFLFPSCVCVYIYMYVTFLISEYASVRARKPHLRGCIRASSFAQQVLYSEAVLYFASWLQRDS